MYTCNGAASHVWVFSANSLHEDKGQSFGGKIKDGTNNKVQEQSTWNKILVHWMATRFFIVI